MKLSNWVKCLQGDHRFARIEVERDSEENENDFNEWFRIYDGYLIKYGFNVKYLKILKVLKKIALLELKFIRTRDPFIETLIAIENEKLNLFKKEHGPGVSIEKALVYISKWYGSHLKASEITVIEYEELSSAYRDAMKESKQERNNNKKRGNGNS